MPSAALLPNTTFLSVAPFSTRNTGFCPSLWLPSPSALVALKVLQPPSYTPLETIIVELTFTVLPGEQVAPVMLPLLLPLLLVLPDEEVDGDDEVVPPEPDDGIEHSFTDFDGIGSEPKVATEQEKLPLRIL